MHLQELDYELPSSLIAQYPVSQRDSSRLLILDRKKKRIIHSRFSRIGEYLVSPKGGLLVLNDSRVFKARLFAKTDRGKVEIFVIERVSSCVFEVLFRPRRRIKEGMILTFSDGTKAKVVNFARNLVEFEKSLDWEDFEKIGMIPLPPYVKREAQKSDEFSYQTVYSKRFGSLAASTAGLHFTPSMLNELRKIGIDIAFITLHISYGTFRPIKSAILEKHPMLAEYFSLSAATAKKINEARNNAKSIIAVGTSVVRALESSIDFSGRVIPFRGFTELFIYPGFKFRIVDRMITNFHLPRSSPLALVLALAGRDVILDAYQEAIRSGYRFYSYGDAMLIL